MSTQQQNLFQIASRQEGFFTAKQAISAGYKQKNLTYHVRRGEWEHVERGVYRLARYPLSDRPDLILWFLWSRGHDDVPRGVYCRDTALSIYELSDVLPARIHMTVPKKFRRSRESPSILRLYQQDLSEDDIGWHNAVKVTTPMRTLVDVICDGLLSDDLVVQAITEAVERGLIISQKQLQERLRTEDTSRLSPTMKEFLYVTNSNAA